MKKGKIDGKIVEIITPEEYYANPSLYPYNYTAIDGHDGFIYPIRSKMDCRPGYYMSPTSPFIKQRIPTPEEEVEYSADNVINFDDAQSMKEIIIQQNKLYDQERSILLSVDNVFTPPIKADDSAEMVGMKQALQAKHCDIDKYEGRFGKKNFQNEKRLFDRPSMTLSKIKKTCDALDIKCTMILEDKSPDVPNPMNTKIVIDITGDANTDEGDDNE